MRSRKWASVAAAAILAVLFTATEARAQAVFFANLRDAVPGKFFDAGLTRVDPANPNHLMIGFDSGFDPLTFTANDFTASALPFSNRQATDALNFTVLAPAGFYVASVKYTQRGTGATTRGSVEMGGATWYVAGVPHLLGTFTSNPTLTQTIDLSRRKLTSVVIVINDSLFASTGTVSITGADVFVTLAKF